MPADHTLYHQIADSLARSIRSGALRRGERLPSVRRIARDRNVSLATATQAYRWLEDARLVEARPRSGYFVAARPTTIGEPQASSPPLVAQRVDRASLAAQVLRLAEDPSVVSFGAACPAEDLFDNERLRRAVTKTALRHRSQLAHYGRVPGHELARRAVARHALRLGCELDPQRLLLTGGCLEAVTLALRAITQPGDVVAIESPAYFGFLQVLEQLQLKALEIPTDPRHGLVVDALQLALDTQPVKAVLVVPTLSNPIGASMPLDERRRLAQLAASRGVPVIEDAIYHDFCPDDERRRAVRSFDPTGHVLLCSSFSKSLAPGLRLGWIDAGRWHAQVERLRATTVGGGSPIVELAIAELLAQPGIEAGLRQLRHRVDGRVDQARELIAQSFPSGTRVTDPAGGFILWVEMPQAVDSMRLYELCLDERIVIAPGTLFSATERYRHCIRIGVGGAWNEATQRALARVGALAGELVDRAAGVPRVPAFHLGMLP